MKVSLTAVFAALHAVLYLLSFGLWRNWGIYLAPIEAIVLGPETGFFAALIGSSIARLIKPDPLFWMFGIVAEPVSVLFTGLLVRGKWKPVLGGYVVMLSAYFIHPFGTALPLWTILDTVSLLVLTYPVAKLGSNLFRTNVPSLSMTLVLTSLVCVATDSLIRIFMLVPCGLYNLFFSGFDELRAVFVLAALDSYVEDALVVVVSSVIGTPLLLSLLKTRIIDRKDTG